MVLPVHNLTLCRVKRNISLHTYYHYTRPVAPEYSLKHKHTHTHYYNIITPNNIADARTRIKSGGGRRTQYSDFRVFRWLRLKKTKPHSNLSPVVVAGDVYDFRRRRCAGTYVPTCLPAYTYL